MAEAGQDVRLGNLYRRMTAMESRIGSIETKLDKVLAALTSSTVAAPKFAPSSRAVPGALFNTAATKAQQMMRPPKAADLLTRGTQLRRVTTRESVGEAKPTELACMEKLYTDKKGDLKTLSCDTGADLALLESHPPKDAADFAKKLLQGAYTAASSEGGHRALGPPTASALQAGHCGLKTIPEVEEKAAMPSEVEVSAMARIYERCEGDLDRIATELGVSAVLLRRHPPADAQDFGRRLLLGVYSDFLDTDASRARLAQAVADGHMKFSEEELEAVSRRLQKVEERLRDDIVPPKSADVEVVANIYNQHNGDWSKIASACDIEEWILKKNPPDGAHDFASRLLGGVYSVGENN